MRLLTTPAAGVIGLVAFAHAHEARADVSSWALVGGGATRTKQGSAPVQQDGALTFEAGAGTTPDASLIVGGIFRATPILGRGTDWSAALRFATHGFQVGGWGLAVDLGGYERFWGVDSHGFAGDVALGLPLGFTVRVDALTGSDHALGMGVFGGIDLARLTVHRRALLNWWSNPRVLRSAARP